MRCGCPDARDTRELHSLYSDDEVAYERTDISSDVGRIGRCDARIGEVVTWIMILLKIRNLTNKDP